VFVVGPGSGKGPHAITVDASRPAATPAPAPTPSPSNPPSPTAEASPAEPDDQFPTGAVPDAPHSADHAVDLSHPASPPEPTNMTGPASNAAVKPEPETPETAPAKVESGATRSPSELEKPAVEPKVETGPVEATPTPAPQPVPSAKAVDEPAPAQAPPVPQSTPLVAAEPKVEAPMPEVKPASEPPQIAKTEPVKTTPDPVPAVAPNAEIKEAATAPKPVKSEPAPDAKIVATEANTEPPRPKASPVEKPKEPRTAARQAKPIGKPMSLGFGRIAKPSSPASKVSSGLYAASVRAAIGRHRPAARGAGSTTVAFSIGPAGGITGLRVARSSGKAELDQAAIATVRSAAPFPPPPAGANPAFSIQIYFR
jgi:periplasmic protein TonB